MLLQSSAVEFFGVRLIGVTPENARKLLLSIAFLVALWAVSRAVRFVIGYAYRHGLDVRARFWGRQAVQLVTAFVAIIVLVSIWFDDPSRFGTVAGLMTAGLAIALQKVVTAVAGYFVILRSRVFNIGDRIVMGGVRGDVMALGWLRTTIMEMGQTPREQEDSPSMWVEARQYTGRVVTVTNDKIFQEPIYNFTKEFPFLMEELRIGIRYGADRERAEQVLLDAVKEEAADLTRLGEEAMRELRRRYFVPDGNLSPRVYVRLTDNWLELAVRFVAATHGIRELKDRISRRILAGLDEAQIQVASTAFEVTVRR